MSIYWQNQYPLSNLKIKKNQFLANLTVVGKNEIFITKTQ